MSDGRRSGQRVEGERQRSAARLHDVTVVAQIDENGRVDGRRAEAAAREQAFQTVITSSG